MRYKIKEIPAGGLVVEEALGEALVREALAGMGADPARTAAAVRLEVTTGGDDVFVRGRLQATVGVECALCLKPARAEVDAPVTVIYRRKDEDEDEEAESDNPLEDTEYAVHDGREIDLSPIVREQLILSIPMSPRCKEGCLGLCSECGQDRNERNCGHRPASVESPLAALKNLNLKL